MNKPPSVDILWQRLSEDSSVGSGLACLRTATSAPCDVFIAVHKPANRLALYIEVPAQLVSHVVEYPESAGFDVHPQSVEAGRQGRVRIILSAAAAEYHDVFRILGDDIVTRITETNTEQQAVAAFLDRLHHWQAFFRRNALAGLGREAQQGLFGELMSLRQDLAPEIGIEQAVSAWRGPLGTNQDFEISQLALEVKTSSASTQQKLYINNVRQLDVTGLDTLYIAFWSLDVRRGTEGTLPELVDDIRNMAHDSVATQNTFSDRLLAAGYLDAHREKYESTAYSVRNHFFFLVRDGFPKIDEQALDAGIGDVRYSIELSACRPFEQSHGEFAASLR